MADRENVICDLRYVKSFGRVSNNPQLTEIAESAIELLEDEEELGEELGNAVELIRKKDERIKKLLKEQQPKTGHWFKKMSSCPSAIAMGGSKICACDLCGGWGRKTFQYCPHCGAKMEKQP